MIFRVIANGTDMGIYEGEDEDAVLDAYAQDVGYEDFADLIEQVSGVPNAIRNDITLEDAQAHAKNEAYRMGREDGYSCGLEEGKDGVRHNDTAPDHMTAKAAQKAPCGELEDAYEAGYVRGWEYGYENGFETARDAKEE